MIIEVEMEQTLAELRAIAEETRLLIILLLAS